MTSVTRSGEPEQRVAEALQARATGAGRGVVGRPMVRTGSTPSPARGMSTQTALLLALLGGTVLGSFLAMLSLLVPGLLPPLG